MPIMTSLYPFVLLANQVNINALLGNEVKSRFQEVYLALAVAGDCITLQLEFGPANGLSIVEPGSLQMREC